MREAISRVGAKEKPVQQDAATSAWAATAPELTQHGGSYLADCQNAKPVALEDPRNGHALWACDVKGAERRFVESEKLKRKNETVSHHFLVPANPARASWLSLSPNS
jgi:hypothetical protein